MIQSGDLRGLVFALVTYVLIFALKLGAYLVTAVMVLLAEAYTLSDIFVSAFLLVALLWWAPP